MTRHQRSATRRNQPRAPGRRAAAPRSAAGRRAAGQRWPLPRRLPQRLEPSDDLAVALHAIDDFARSIHIADAKSGALGAVLGLMLGSLVDHPAFWPAAQVRGGSQAAFGMFLVSLLIAGACLGLTQIPRLVTAEHTGRTAFPAAARADGPPAGGAGIGLADEAWLQARTLARIALTKFRYLRVAFVATGVCVVAFLCYWLTALPVI